MCRSEHRPGAALRANDDDDACDEEAGGYSRDHQGHRGDRHQDDRSEDRRHQGRHQDADRRHRHQGGRNRDDRRRQDDQLELDRGHQGRVGVEWACPTHSLVGPAEVGLAYQTPTEARSMGRADDYRRRPCSLQQALFQALFQQASIRQLAPRAWRRQEPVLRLLLRGEGVMGHLIR